MANHKQADRSYVLHVEIEYSEAGFFEGGTAHYRARLIRTDYADRPAYGESEHEAIYRLGRYIYEVETDSDIEDSGL